MLVNTKDYPEIKEFLRNAMPGYRKHRVSVLPSDEFTVRPSYWDGGTRDHYATAQWPSGHGFTAQSVPFNFLGKLETKTLPIDHHTAGIEYGTFRGQRAVVTITLHPEVYERVLAKALEQLKKEGYING